MNFGIILASGNGKRMNNHTPKQFLEINGKPLIYYSIQAFEAATSIDEIIVVTQKKFFKKIYEIIEKFNFNKVHMLVEGGKTRQESSFNALGALKGFATSKDLVFIHDAARPLISSKLIEEMVIISSKHQSITMVGNVIDTIATNNKNHYGALMDRSSLVAIQTPQVFKYGIILRAHKQALKNNICNASDDAQLVTMSGKKVYLFKNADLNFKITTPMDLKLLEYILSRGD